LSRVNFAILPRDNHQVDVARSRYADHEVGQRFTVLASLLRMGTKYAVPYLRQVAVTKLVKLYPSTLDAYRLSREGDFRTSLVADYDIYMSPAAITLAHECQLSIILPACLWTLTPECSGHINYYSHIQYRLEDQRVYRIDKKTARCCVDAGWQLAEKRQRAIISAFTKPAFCQGTCREEARTVLFNALGDSAFLPLFSKIVKDRYKVCAECASMIESEWENEMQVLWGVLPQSYEFAGWEDLRRASL
jgi:hypothetical protein